MTRLGLKQSAMGSFASNLTCGAPEIANKPGDKASSDAIRVLLAATELVREANTASSSFREEPLSAFRFKTAEQLVREG